jgi:hypothetical protein
MGCNAPTKRAIKGLFINTVCALYVKNATKNRVQLTTTRIKKYSIDPSVTAVLGAAPLVSLDGTS